MSDRKDPIAMGRAEEVVETQRRQSLSAPGGEPPGKARAVTEPAAAKASSSDLVRRLTMIGYLRLASAVLLLGAAVLLFAPAVKDAIRRARAGSPGGEGAVVGPPVKKDLTLSIGVQSKPDGARVYVNDVAHGETPTLFNIVCTAGAAVEVEVDRDGYEPFKQTVTCAQGGTLEVDARLVKKRR